MGRVGVAEEEEREMLGGDPDAPRCGSLRVYDLGKRSAVISIHSP